MKRIIHASEKYDEIDKYLRSCVRNIANYAYNNAHLREDDPRADYYVENICEDSDVMRAKDALNTAIHAAIDRQQRGYVQSSIIGNYRGYEYGLENKPDQRYYFVDDFKKIHYGELEEEIKSKIDKFIEKKTSSTIESSVESYQLYRNKRNENKYIEVKKTSDGHTWFRQFMYWNTPEGSVKNYNASKTNRGRYHRVRLSTLDSILEDYEPVEDVHTEEDVFESTAICASWPEELTFEEYSEGDQIIEVFIDVVDDLELFEEPSAQGGVGTDYFYNDEGDVVGKIDLQREEEELQQLYYNSKNRLDFKHKVKRWMKDLCNIEEDVFESKKIAASWPEELTFEEYPEGDQIAEVCSGVIDELNLFDEPEVYGRNGTIYYYDYDTGDLLGHVDVKKEDKELRKLYDSSTSKDDFRNKVKQWYMKLCKMNNQPEKWFGPNTYEKGLSVNDGIVNCLTEAAKSLGYDTNINTDSDAIEFYKDNRRVGEIDTKNYNYALNNLYKHSLSYEKCIESFKSYIKIFSRHFSE